MKHNYIANKTLPTFGITEGMIVEKCSVKFWNGEHHIHGTYQGKAVDFPEIFFDVAPVTKVKIDIVELSKVFSACMLESIGEDDVRKAVEENARRKDDSCATHDYCDSNMIMIDALHSLANLNHTEGYEFIRNNTALINAAWDLAKSSSFGLAQPVNG